MKIKDFNKIIKQETPQKIIQLFCSNKIYLTDKQLTEVINLKYKDIGKRMYE